MTVRLPLLCAALAVAAAAQPTCPATPTYQICELVFELDAKEAVTHPNPYLTAQLHIEFRSPRHRTFLLPAYWDGGNRLVVRFTPVDAGEWAFRISSNLARFDGKQGTFTSSESEAPGFIRPRNVHHWAYTEGNRPHLWLGDTVEQIAALDKAGVEQRVRGKFTHVRGAIHAADAYRTPDQPNPEYFQRLDAAMRALHEQGLVADLILGGGDNDLVNRFPSWQQRERYIRYVASRYSAFNITWQITREFESYTNGRELLKELGALLKKYDPFQHPRTTGARVTSAPLLADGWMDHVLYQSGDEQLGSVEHQLYQVPFVNAGISGGNAAAFRKALWNAAASGQYPTVVQGDAKVTEVWHDFFAGTRHWELEPYFDVDGGRAVALEGVEYIIYVEKPGPVEVAVEKHGYDVAWIDPGTGERTPVKDFKADRFAGEPPNRSHDWVLHISREGRKEGMLRSYRFESRPVPVQEVEQSAQRAPFEIAEPAGDTFSASKPVKFAAKLKRETRATRSMMYLWTGEVATEGQGFRVLGTGRDGTLAIPKGYVKRFPAVLNLRVTALNANGKAYVVDRVYTVTE